MQIVNGLHFNNIRGDIFGGLTAAVVALPLALAFGVSSGAGPVAGLYGAICVGLFAALFGGTPAQVSGPTGPMTVIMAVIFTEYTSMDPVQGPALAFTVVIMGGLFQIGFGLARIGRYINYVPLPVISGFMSGIGIIIILLQLGPLLGQAASSGPMAALFAFPAALANMNIAALMLGAITVVVVYLTPAKLGRFIPSPLLALLVGTLLWFILPNKGVTVLGDIPTGLPQLMVPNITLDLLPGMLKSALILALLGTIDSLLTSLVADNITRSHHESDRELIGQGIGNTIAGFFGGLPGAGATMRTVVNVRAGGQTPISGVLHALVLLAIVLGFGPIAGTIPHVVLAGILIKVGTDIIDWDYLKRVHISPAPGVVIMFTVLLMTVFVDLIIAVAAGMSMASMLHLKRHSDVQLSKINIMRSVDEESPLSDEEADILNGSEGHLLLFHIGGPMSFGAAKEMVKMLAYQQDYRVLVLDMSDVPSLDYTSCQAIKDMVNGTLDAGRNVVIALPPDKPCVLLQREQVLDTLPIQYRHTSRLSALRYAQQLLEIQSQIT